MLTAAGPITHGPHDRQGVSIVSLNGRRSQQTGLANHRSGASGTGEGPALLLGARELRCFPRIGRGSTVHLGDVGWRMSGKFDTTSVSMRNF
jgi:hypothetical protein